MRQPKEMNRNRRDIYQEINRLLAIKIVQAKRKVNLMCAIRQMMFVCVFFGAAVPVLADPIIIVSELGPEVDVDELERRFLIAMGEMGSTCDGSNIDIRLIDYGQYKYTAGMINYYTDKPTAGDVTIVPSDFDDTKWKLRFADENMDIISLQISGVPQTLTIEGDAVGGKGESGKQLWLRTAGEYNLTLPNDFVADSYTIKATNIETGEQEEIKGEWPKLGRYAEIKIAGHCVSDVGRLSRILQDEDLIGEPIYLSDIKQSVRILHAHIGETTGIAQDPWKDGLLYVTIPRPENRNPKRAWMAYPLSYDEMKAKLATLKNADGSFKKGPEISQIIRNQGVLSAGTLNNESRPIYYMQSYDDKWYE